MDHHCLSAVAGHCIALHSVKKKKGTDSFLNLKKNFHALKASLLYSDRLYATLL